MIVPRWESNHLPIVIQKVSDVATYVQIETAELTGPVWRMARAVGNL